MSGERDRAQRFAELRKLAAEETGLDIEHERVGQLAALRLQAEALQARLIAGAAVETRDLLELSKALRELSPQAPMHITVEYIEHTPHCPACGWRRGVAVADAATDLPKAPVAETLTSLPLSAAVEPSIEPVPNVVSIHDGAPLQHYAEPWRGHV